MGYTSDLEMIGTVSRSQAATSQPGNRYMQKFALLPIVLLVALIAQLCATRANAAPQDQACVANVTAFPTSCQGFTASWAFTFSSSGDECDFCEFSGTAVVVDDATGLIVDSTTAPTVLGCDIFERRKLSCPMGVMVTFVFTCSECIDLGDYEPGG